jgi:tetratricopeptide (TPR) repeat protein
MAAIVSDGVLSIQAKISRGARKSGQPQNKSRHLRASPSYPLASMPLDDPDELHLRAACAYVEEGMFDEAQAELEKIDPRSRLLPELLAARIPLYRSLEKWEPMAIAARRLSEWNPEEPGHFVNWAYAITRMESIHAAHAILMRATSLHPTDGMIHFRLACYEAQMGRLDRAKAHLKRATEIDAKFRLMALEDPDLEALWVSMSTERSGPV